MKRQYRFLAAELVLVLLIGCYRSPVSREIMQAPGNQIWTVQTQKSGSGYRTHSTTSLNGADPMRDQPTAVIASGSTGNWQWEVRAVPSLLSSWKAWQSDKEVQLTAGTPDDWSHPAASWEQAFERAYKTVNYLLGGTPPPAKVTLLLIPKGSAYKKVFVQTGNGSIPLTFAFYYPSAGSETDSLTSDRFAALVKAVSTFVHEYQHTLVKTEAIEQKGDNVTDRTINSEIRSQCWEESTTFSLATGTESSLKWTPALPDELIERSTGHSASRETRKPANDIQENPRPRPRRFSDAELWGGHLLAKNVSAYLLDRGFPKAEVSNSDLKGMNALLSFCRAITQHPRDLTAGPYAPSQIEYIPFFSSTLNPEK